MCLNNGWLENLQQALAELPDGWMQLYLSAMNFRPASRVSPRLLRLGGAYQNTAILYSEAGIAAALNCPATTGRAAAPRIAAIKRDFDKLFVILPFQQKRK